MGTRIKLENAEAQDFARQMVGKTITTINASDGYFTLSDGTVLSIADAGDCCAWFEGEIKNVNLTQNVITSVENLYGNPDDVDNFLFSIVIYSVDQEVASVEVTGNEGSGYYGSSITLIVNKPNN